MFHAEWFFKSGGSHPSVLALKTKRFFTSVNPLILFSAYGLPLFVGALLKLRNRNRPDRPELENEPEQLNNCP